MQIIDAWELDSNFWKINPQFLVKETFSKLYEEDKTKNKAESSRIMWGLALLCDFTSKYRQLSFGERKDLIGKDFLKDPNFNWKAYDEQIKGWEIFKTSAQKQMMQWERLINEKTIFLDTQTYDANTAELIEKLLMSNTKLYKEYEDIMARLSQEDSGGTMKGGSMESASEKGDI